MISNKKYIELQERLIKLQREHIELGLRYSRLSRSRMECRHAWPVESLNDVSEPVEGLLVEDLSTGLYVMYSGGKWAELIGAS